METVLQKRVNLKVFVAHRDPERDNHRARPLSYQVPPDQFYQIVQLLLYILGFFTMILIFLYIAYERPSEKPARKEEAE